jgi:hypothetical protein
MVKFTGMRMDPGSQWINSSSIVKCEWWQHTLLHHATAFGKLPESIPPCWRAVILCRNEGKQVHTLYQCPPAFEWVDELDSITYPRHSSPPAWHLCWSVKEAMLVERRSVTLFVYGQTQTMFKLSRDWVSHRDHTWFHFAFLGYVTFYTYQICND